MKHSPCQMSREGGSRGRLLVTQAGNANYLTAPAVTNTVTVR